MDFKSLLNNDLSNIFFNKEEFAREATIDNTKVMVLMDDELLKAHKFKNGGEGLIDDGLLFHVQKNDMPFIPKPQQNITFNESYYQIVDVQEDEGMYTITLEGYES